VVLCTPQVSGCESSRAVGLRPPSPPPKARPKPSTPAAISHGAEPGAPAGGMAVRSAPAAAGNVRALYEAENLFLFPKSTPTTITEETRDMEKVQRSMWR